MKNFKFYLIQSFVFLSTLSFVFSQEKCASNYIEQRMRSFMPNYEQIRADIEQNIANFSSTQILNKTTYNIPVVVHVMHLGEAVGTGTNITDQQIISAINSINTSYANNNVNINFCLAQQTITGEPCSGINRVLATGVSQYSTKGICMGMSGTDNESELKALSNWNNTKYYNIWIVSEIENNNGADGIQGFAYFPGAPNGTDGAVMLYNAFGYDPGVGNSSGFNLKDYTDLNATFIHEMGHALNLYHSFEGDGSGSTCPTGNQCGTGLGDCCSDTPPHKRSNSDCVVGSNSCDGGTSTNLYIHNYMDYSSESCQSEFTTEQKTRMEAVMTGVRASLTSSSGCNPSNNSYDASILSIIEPSSSYCQTTFTPKVNLKNYGTQTLTNVTINYNIDGGTNQIFNWNGSLTSGSTEIVTLNSVTTSNGSHTFNVSTSNPNGQNDEYTNNDSNSLSFNILTSTSLPFVENFEGTTFPPTGWTKTSEDTSPTTWDSDGVKEWVKKTTAGNGTSTASAGINLYNYNTNLGSLDVLTTPFINLSGASNPVFTFKVANKNYPGQTDYLKVYVSDDCGVTFTNVFNKSGSALATNGSSTSTFVPSVANDWRTETIDISSYSGKVITVKFESTNGYGNNLFIDDININSDCTAPIVNTQPVNSTICNNSNTSFTFTQTGGVSYQWQVNTGSGFTNISNGGAYSGATTTTLSINSVNTSYSGYLYRCIITNSCGNATTNSATLTVNQIPSAPTISTSGSTTFCQGESVTLTSSSNNGNQWSNGSTSNSINVTSSGSFYVNITQNGCTSSNSNTINVTVNPLPNVSLSTINDICDTASTFTFTQGTPSGGIYVVNGVTATNFDPSSNNIGVNTVVYTYTENNCTNTDQTTFTVLECNGAGLTEENKEIKLFPNPSKGIISILGVDKKQIDEIKVYDAVGKIVLSDKKINLIDMSNLSDGYYRISLKINDKENIFTIQIVK